MCACIVWNIWVITGLGYVSVSMYVLMHALMHFRGMPAVFVLSSVEDLSDATQPEQSIKQASNQVFIQQAATIWSYRIAILLQR